MQQHDYDRFSAALVAVSELYGKSMSEGTIALWWQAMERYDFEQVNRAIMAHTRNAESGQFAPRPADLIRFLEGTTTDRAAIAWGKALDAASRVGAYSDVVFDDAAIHAAIEDMGGWPKFCQGETKDLSFTQNRFCVAHRAYTGRDRFDYPRRLAGDRSPNEMYTKRGLPPPKPAVIGDIEQARLVYRQGGDSGKTAIGFIALSESVNAETTKMIDAPRRHAA